MSASSVPQPQNGFVEVYLGHLASADGVRDAFDCCARVAEAVKLCFANSEVGQVASRAQDLFDNTGFGLSLTKIPGDCAKLYRSVVGLSKPGKEPVEDDGVLVNALSLMNSGVKTLLYARAFDVVRLTVSWAGRLGGFSNFASIVASAVDFKKDWTQWWVVGAKPESHRLAFMNMVKDVGYIAISALLLVGYAFSLMAQPYLIMAVFVLSVVALTAGLMGCFYDKMWGVTPCKTS